MYGDSSSSMATVENWFNELQHRVTSVFVELSPEPHPGAPKTVSIEYEMTKAHNMLLTDR